MLGPNVIGFSLNFIKLFSNRLHIMSWIYPSNAYCSPFCFAFSDISPVCQKLLIISLGMSDTGAYIL